MVLDLLETLKIGFVVGIPWRSSAKSWMFHYQGPGYNPWSGTEIPQAMRYLLLPPKIRVFEGLLA